MPAQREQQAYQSPLARGSVPADVAQECAQAGEKGWPFTELRPIRQGVDDPQRRRCEGCIGHFHEDCDKPVVAVQYSSAQGEPFFYCEEHGIAEDEWEDALYRSKPQEPPEPSAEWRAEVEAVLRKLNRGKRRRDAEEPAEDLTT